MQNKWYIAVLVVTIALAVGCWSPLQADDVLDDVYYWDADKSADSRSNTYYVSDDYAEPVTVTLTFIEDSITLHSDTVVRAVIHR
ncbi:MAG: hypothetical protein ACI30A_03020 [Paludibacteraceae bacterium]